MQASLTQYVFRYIKYSLKLANFLLFIYWITLVGYTVFDIASGLQSNIDKPTIIESPIDETSQSFSYFFYETTLLQQSIIVLFLWTGAVIIFALARGLVQTKFPIALSRKQQVTLLSVVLGLYLLLILLTEKQALPWIFGLVIVHLGVVWGNNFLEGLA